MCHKCDTCVCDLASLSLVPCSRSDVQTERDTLALRAATDHRFIRRHHVNKPNNLGATAQLSYYETQMFEFDQLQSLNAASAVAGDFPSQLFISGRETSIQRHEEGLCFTCKLGSGIVYKLEVIL